MSLRPLTSSKRDEHWNRCDICGHFISMMDFINGDAVRTLLTPDSDLSDEEYETLCKKHRDERTII